MRTRREAQNEQKTSVTPGNNRPADIVQFFTCLRFVPIFAYFSRLFCLLFAPLETNLRAQTALEPQSPARRGSMRLDTYFDRIKTRFARGLSANCCERIHARRYYVNPVPKIYRGNAGRARSLSRSNKPAPPW